jgi:hypothetical protein
MDENGRHRLNLQAALCDLDYHYPWLTDKI